jgi:hypothetical protein
VGSNPTLSASVNQPLQRRFFVIGTKHCIFFA